MGTICIVYRTFGELHVNEALQLLKISLFDNFNGNASVGMHALREMRNYKRRHKYFLGFYS